MDAGRAHLMFRAALAKVFPALSSPHRRGDVMTDSPLRLPRHRAEHCCDEDRAAPGPVLVRTTLRVWPLWLDCADARPRRWVRTPRLAGHPGRPTLGDARLGRWSRACRTRGPRGPGSLRPTPTAGQQPCPSDRAYPSAQLLGSWLEQEPWTRNSIRQPSGVSNTRHWQATSRGTCTISAAWSSSCGQNLPRSSLTTDFSPSTCGSLPTRAGIPTLCCLGGVAGSINDPRTQTQPSMRRQHDHAHRHPCSSVRAAEQLNRDDTGSPKTASTAGFAGHE